MMMPSVNRILPHFASMSNAAFSVFVRSTEGERKSFSLLGNFSFSDQPVCRRLTPTNEIVD